MIVNEISLAIKTLCNNSLHYKYFFGEELDEQSVFLIRCFTFTSFFPFFPPFSLALPFFFAHPRLSSSIPALLLHLLSPPFSLMRRGGRGGKGREKVEQKGTTGGGRGKKKGGEEKDGMEEMKRG